MEEQSVSLIRIFFLIAVVSRHQCPSLLGIAKHDVEALRKAPETGAAVNEFYLGRKTRFTS